MEQFESVEVNVWVPDGRLVFGSSEKDNIDFDWISGVISGVPTNLWYDDFSIVGFFFVGSVSVILGQSVDFGLDLSVNNVDFGHGLG